VLRAGGQGGAPRGCACLQQAPPPPPPTHTHSWAVPPPPRAQVLDTEGKPVPHLYCIGDANGKYMLAHAASAQGIAAVETMCGRERVVNHLAVPAACFTHPEVSFVGLTEDAAREKAEKEGWADKLGVAKTYYKVGWGVCGGGGGGDCKVGWAPPPPPPPRPPPGQQQEPG
jgi:hypothetical protein